MVIEATKLLTAARWLSCVLGTVFCCALPWFATIVHAEGVDQATIVAEMQKLEDTAYSNRESASAFLSEYPLQTIPLILRRLTGAHSDPQSSFPDPESSLRMLRLLSTWAKEPDRSPGIEAFQALEKLARGTSTVTAIRAQNLLADITLEHSVVVTKRLQQRGVFIGHATIQVVTTETNNRYMLRLDDEYQGSINELRSLRWLVDIDMVHARGELIDSEVLEHIASMPNLRVLQIRSTSLSAKDLELLAKMRQLEVLELLYSEVEPSAIELLAELPVSHSLRLFGTGLDPKALDALNDKLEGIEFIHGRGGFLGIMAEGGDTNVIRDVVEGSGAALADIRREDKIVAINKVPITRFEEIRNELAKFAADEVIEVEIERPTYHLDESKGQRAIWQTLTLQVKLGMQK